MSTLKNVMTLIFIFLFISSLSYSQKYKPVIKVSKGQQYNYTTQMLMDMLITAGGQEMKMSITSDYTAKNTIDKIGKKKKIDVINSNWDLTMTTKGMGKDSTIKKTGKIGPVYKHQFDKLGNYITKIVIDSTDMKLNLDNNSSNMTVFCEFPNKKIVMGEKWTKNRLDTVDVAQIGGRLGIKGQTEYTLASKEKVEGKDLYKITYTTNLTLAGKGEMMGMNISMEGTGAGSGEIFINPVNGVIIICKSNVEMDMNMAISGAQSMTMPMTQKITITQKLIQ